MERDGDAGLAIFTVGHSNHGQDDFVALLRRHAIGLVVDVRSAPFSRWAPHFNRRQIAAELTRQGIAYAYAGDRLGGRPDDPVCYKRGEIPTGDIDFLKEVDYPAVARQPWFQEGIARLLDLAAGETVALMCSEEDPARCHRHHLIAQDLLDRGVAVTHIRGDGTVEAAARETVAAAPAQLALFGGAAGPGSGSG